LFRNPKSRDFCVFLPCFVRFLELYGYGYRSDGSLDGLGEALRTKLEVCGGRDLCSAAGAAVLYTAEWLLRRKTVRIVEA